MEKKVLEWSNGDSGFPNNFRVDLENEEFSILGFTKRGPQFTETPILPFFLEGCFNSFCERPRLKPRQDACQLIGAQGGKGPLYNLHIYPYHGTYIYSPTSP